MSLPAPLAGAWPQLAAQLREWLPARRWFPGTAPLTHLGLKRAEVLGGSSDRLVLLVLVVDAELADGVRLPVQVTAVAQPDEAAHAATSAEAGAGSADEIARLTAGGRSWTVREGCSDPRLVAGYLATIEPLPEARDSWAGLDPAAACPLGREQSNSSVVVPGAEGAALLKVLRIIAPGPHPDVELPLALWRAGWRHVPRPLGSRTVEVAGGAATSAIVTSFVPGAADGFGLACARAQEREPFGELVQLGSVLRSMHETLARALPTQDDVNPAHLAGQLRERAEWAFGALPLLTEFRPAVSRLIDQVGALNQVPARQRIHGDFHLGQTLHRPDGQWLVLDFEGEPLAPLVHRNRPDLALRDVAGLARSIDYAAAIGGATLPWQDEARAHLAAGYGLDLARGHGALLLTAFEVDKALYECVYEAAGRPDWLQIPLEALARLTR